MISPDLLNILACPVCNGDLVAAEVDLKLLCLSCSLAFPVKNGIPVMLVDQAEKIA
jgi:uncharacterized protein YbaR (Trm112 family)